MRAGAAIVEHIRLLPGIDVELVGHAPRIPGVGEAARDVAVVAERFGLRLPAAAEQHRRLGCNRHAEMIDDRNAGLGFVGPVASDGDAIANLLLVVQSVGGTVFCHALQ